LAILGNLEVGENTAPSDFSRVFNLLNINRKAGFYKLEIFSWSLGVGIFIALLL